MFDIGFWEILFIGVVGLLVLGPERLPTVATMAGQWIGRLRRFANHMRKEIRDELEAEHLKQVLEEQNREMQSLRKEMTEVRREAESAASTDTDTGQRRTKGAGAGARSDQRRSTETAGSPDAAERPDNDKQSSRDENHSQDE